MKQHVLELPVVEVADTPSNGKPANTLLVRLLDEAEQTVATQRPPRPPVRRRDSAEKTVRVRYTYD